MRCGAALEEVRHKEVNACMRRWDGGKGGVGGSEGGLNGGCAWSSVCFVVTPDERDNSGDGG